MTTWIDPVPIGAPSFLDTPRCGNLETLVADVAVLGMPYTTPMDLAGSRSECSLAPERVRAQSLRFAGSLGHYDFEFRGDLLAGRAIRIVDCGDVAMLPGRYEDNSRRATVVVESILARGAFPVILGGDHGATVPALRACAGQGPICVVHFGSDLDWRDEVSGVRTGRSSALRRASELPWVSSMIQIGLRGLGSSLQHEVEAAERFGSVLVSAEELHEQGVESILSRVPDATRYYVSLDAGVLDPSIAPGVEAPAFGGFSYFEATNLLKGIAGKGRVLGMDLVGIAPGRDFVDQTSLLGARLILNLVGALAHAGQLGDVAGGATRAEPQVRDRQGVGR